jgi:hypothetical protein
MLDELISRVTQSAGIDAGVAQQAVGQILSFLKKEGPAGPVAEVFGKIPGADEAAAAADGSAGGGGMMGAIGGMMGGGGGLMGLAGKLTGLGLGMGEMQTVGKEVFAFAREKAGEDAVGQIAGAIPGMSQFI